MKFTLLTNKILTNTISILENGKEIAICGNRKDGEKIINALNKTESYETEYDN